ncbi:MAG: glycosyltransferase [Candidatus Sericytochromatia bacterium]
MGIINLLDNFLKYPDKLTGFKNHAHARLEKTNYKSAERRFLFVIADSGGGHRTTANAVKAEIESLIPNSCIFLMPGVDILAHPQRVFGRLVEETYNTALKVGAYWVEPFLFKSLSGMELPLMFEYIYLRNSQLIETFNPEAIISFVPATQNISYYALKYLKREKEIPLYTVITDLNSMRDSWIIEDQSYSFVPTEKAKDFFIKLGIKEEKMIVTGLPVNPKFYKKFDNIEELKEKYELKKDLFTIMIIMGGYGSYSIYKYSKLIEELNLPVQIIACCGKSKSLYENVTKLSKESKTPIKVLGFTDKLPELMAISDVIISKPGSVTVVESINQNLPLLIDASNYIMWQEKGNAEYIEENKIGMAFRSETDLSEKIKFLVTNKDKYLEIKNNIVNFPKSNATNFIAKAILEPNKYLNEKNYF